MIPSLRPISIFITTIDQRQKGKRFPSFQSTFVLSVFYVASFKFGVWIVCFSFYLFLSTNQLLEKFSRCAIMIGHVAPCCRQSYRSLPIVIISHVVNMSYQAFSIQWAPVCFEEEWLQWTALITNYSLERGERREAPVLLTGGPPWLLSNDTTLPQ